MYATGDLHFVRLLFAAVAVGLCFTLGCNQIPNPCERFSKLQFSEMQYSSVMKNGYVEIGAQHQSVLEQILTSQPRQFRGSSAPFPSGYLKIDGNVFKISASIDYGSAHGHLRWSDKRIERIGSELRNWYFEIAK